MSLLAPLFLIGLLAAALPWWLHRLSASNPPQHDFGSTRFLTANESTSSKKRRTRYFALLALRILFLALLSLLFAQPVIEKLQALTESSVRHILLVDTSLSQSAGDRWQRSKEIASDILNGASSGDEATIISASDQFIELESDYTTASARGLLNSLEPQQSRLDYGRIAAAVAAAVSDSNIDNHLHIITDAQTTALPERFTELAVDKVQKVTIHTTSTDTDSNVSVTAKLGQIKDTRASVVAIVNNYSEATGTTLTASSNGNTLATTSLEIPAGGSRVHRFEDLDLTNAGSQLEISISANDALSADDSWIVPLPSTSKTDITVLVSDTERTLASTYVTAAVESDNRFRTRLIEASRFTANDAGGLVIVPSASVLSDNSARRLAEFVNEGGNVLIATGSKPHGSGASTLIGITSSGSSTTELSGGAIAVGSVDSAHQITANIDNNWRAISVINHARLRRDITDRTLVELSNGVPLLVEKRPGAGKLLVLSTALNTAWTDLPTTPVFVAFIIRAIDYLGGDTGTALYHSIGDIIGVASGTQLIDPQGQPMRDLSEISERTTLKLEQTGIYQLRNSAGTQVIAVNTDPRESNITQIDSDTINDWQQMARGESVTKTATQTTGAKNHKGIWLWLLPLLLLIAIAESLYSHRHLWVRREA